LFEFGPVSGNDRLVESKAGFRAVPVDEFADAVIIGPLGTPRGEAVQDCGFRLFEIRQLQDGFGIVFPFVLGHFGQFAPPSAIPAHAIAFLVTNPVN
jgi:hypothetical protein